MNFFSKAKEIILKHKFITLIIIIILLAGGYYGYGAMFPQKTSTTYATAAAVKGTITTSVSGSGQVSASNTISLQFKASGTLVYLPVQNGQNVSAGQLIAELDTTDAQKTVRNAEASLQSAQIALQKLEGASTLTTPQNKQDAINNVQNATDTLNQDYQSAYNTISSTFTELPGLMTDLQGIIYGYNFDATQQNIDYYTYGSSIYDQTANVYRSSLVESYKTASDEYTKNFIDYKSTTRSSDNKTVDSLISETYNTARDVAQALKDTNNLIQFYEDTLTKYNIKVNSITNTQLATINSDSSKSNSEVTNLLNIQNTLKNDKNSIITANNAVGNSDLDLQSQQLSLQNAQNSLQDAKDTLSNYYIYAPFSGTIGKITVQKLAQVGSGTSVATLVTTQKICVIPLNEVDVSKVKSGQKVVLTFDAIPDLSVAGQVATVDPIGTTTSGVVTYNVQINFDTQDSRVKSGMSISAQIITNVAQDVLTVPNSAVKTQGTTKYVQILVNGIPEQKIVTVGLVNDSSTQILSGINEGDKIITQTITTGASASSATSAARTGASSTVRIPGLTGGAGFRGN